MCLAQSSYRQQSGLVTIRQRVAKDDAGKLIQWELGHWLCGVWVARNGLPPGAVMWSGVRCSA
jgi:hypothetical protein